MDTYSRRAWGLPESASYGQQQQQHEHEWRNVAGGCFSWCAGRCEMVQLVGLWAAPTQHSHTGGRQVHEKCAACAA
jgi:hypothetical protein